MKKYFIITIDTEGDNLWSVKNVSDEITTRNASFLYRFQELCEKYGFIPTYLTNYEMAKDAAMIELGRRGIKEKTLEIGAHIHAWNQPPIYSLQRGIGRRGKPYLGEYPKEVVSEKIDYLTKTLQDTFQCKISSHRGGRWYLDKHIINELAKQGYIVDCTCTPNVNWKSNLGWKNFSRGVDWSGIKEEVFYINGEENRHLVEIPVTIRRINGNDLVWFRPDGNNEKKMQYIIHNNKDFSYIEFMIHSSELMPGGSPIFDRKWKISKLYEDLEFIFSELLQTGFSGIGLTDFAIMMEKSGNIKGEI